MKVFHLCWKEWVVSFLILLCPRKPAAAAHMEPLVNCNTRTLHGLSTWGPGPGYGPLNCDLYRMLNNKTEALQYHFIQFLQLAVIPQWGQGNGWHDCLSPLRCRHQRLSQLRTSWKCVRFWIRTKEFTFFPFQILPLENVRTCFKSRI